MDDKKVEIETYAVKLDKELKMELQELIRSSEGTGNDFIKLMLDMYKANKEPNDDFKYLNSLVRSIYNHYKTMVENNEMNIININKEAMNHLDDKDDYILELKEHIEKVNKNKENEIMNIKADNKQTQIELQELRTIHKEQLDELRQLRDKAKRDDNYINKLEQESEDIKEIKQEAKRLEITVNDLTDINKKLEDNLQTNKHSMEILRKQLQDKETEHKRAQKQQEVELDLKCQKQIIDIEKKHILEMQNQQQQYMSKFKEYETLKNTMHELNEK